MLYLKRMSEKGLKILNPSNFIDSNNVMRITSVTDTGIDKDAVLSRNPRLANLSYYTQTGRGAKDLHSFLRKFRCKNCHNYGQMKPVKSKPNSPHIIEALMCGICLYMHPLDVPIDKNNIGAVSPGVDKRPSLIGKSTKFKSPISEGQKLGLGKILRKSRPEYMKQGNSRTQLLSDSEPKPNNMLKLIHSSLKKSGYPNVSVHSSIKKVEDIDKDDIEFSQYMSGMGIVRQVTTPPEKVRQGVFLF